MNLITVNVDAMTQASVALLGVEKTRILSEVYTMLDQAERRGFDQGVAETRVAAYEDGRAAGFVKGYNDATDDADVDYHSGFADGEQSASNAALEVFNEGYDQGYDDAREELGECPIVDQDFDKDEFTLIFHSDAEARD